MLMFYDQMRQNIHLSQSLYIDLITCWR